MAAFTSDVIGGSTEVVDRGDYKLVAGLPVSIQSGAPGNIVISAGFCVGSSVRKAEVPLYALTSGVPIDTVIFRVVMPFHAICEIGTPFSASIIMFFPCGACSEICVKGNALVSIYEACDVISVIDNAISGVYKACTIGRIGGALITNSFIPCEACSQICVKASALVSIYEARLIDITIGKAVEVPYEACTIGSIGNTP